MLRALLARFQEWIEVDDPEERISGPGDVILDPAYNGRYEAELELQRLAEAAEAESESEAERDTEV